MRCLAASVLSFLGVFLIAGMSPIRAAEPPHGNALWLPLVRQPSLPHARVRVDPSCCRFNALGDDRYNLDGEYVCFQNNGLVAVTMTGWLVRDETTKTFIFPKFRVPSKARVKVHTGAGDDTATDLYWGRGSPVWNNDGDTVYLYDPEGRLVDRYAYRWASE